jgi:hypothetical protein
MMKTIKCMIANLVKLFIRLLSVFVYIFPFLEAYIYVSQFLLNQGYYNSALTGLGLDLRYSNNVSIAVFATTLFLIKRKWVPYLYKYHSMVSLLLSMIISLFDLASYNFPSFVLAQGSVIFTICHTFIFLLIALMMYCVLFALSGKRPKIPFITPAVYVHLRGMGPE